MMSGICNSYLQKLISLKEWKMTMKFLTISVMQLVFVTKDIYLIQIKRGEIPAFLFYWLRFYGSDW